MISLSYPMQTTPKHKHQSDHNNTCSKVLDQIEHKIENINVIEKPNEIIIPTPLIDQPNKQDQIFEGTLQTRNLILDQSKANMSLFKMIHEVCISTNDQIRDIVDSINKLSNMLQIQNDKVFSFEEKLQNLESKLNEVNISILAFQTLNEEVKIKQSKQSAFTPIISRSNSASKINNHTQSFPKPLAKR